MRRLNLPIGTLIAALSAAPSHPALGQICPPAPGVAVPAPLLEVLQREPRAFQLQHAWIQKAARARALRSELARGAASATTASDGARQPGAAANRDAVGGAFQVPLFLVEFANTPSTPYPAEQLTQELFDTATGAQSLADFYAKVSDGRVVLSGAVYGWHRLPNPDSWYEGSSNGGNPGNAHVGELIKDTLDSYDGTVDFGQFDNDGEDGIPNSGDDDGYVDFVAFVQPERGGECGGSGNIWSHRWVYHAWQVSGGVPYRTDDAAANGGRILVDDYTIQPAISCAGIDQRIEIGVFCHEFGHAFGLPDLYDINGGSAGLGHWCLMASGNWNTPDSPASMGAWAKRELGWVTTVPVDWRGTRVTLPPVEVDPVVYELSFTDDRWRRRTDCPLTGGASLALGLTTDESAARGWAAQKGYGNGWRETICHDFRFDGTGPVILSYRYAVQSEALYDYAFAIVEVGGVESPIVIYDGTKTGSASFDLRGLLGAQPTDYRIKFRFTSDIYFSNEDGHFTVPCSPFRVDDVSVQGGGVHYSTDFERNLAGWYQPNTELDNPRSERWLVENRQAVSYDAQLHGDGLVIYHVDQEVMESGNANTGGMTNNTVRGVTIEEADGRSELATGANRGDAGDVYPGSAANHALDGASVPASRSNSGHLTRVAVEDIVVTGQNVTATFSAGDPAPAFAAVSPDSARNDATALVVELVGASEIAHGATLRLVRAGVAPVPATSVDWQDRDDCAASFDFRGIFPGRYDVVVENPDGQTAVLAESFRVSSPAVTAPPADPPQAVLPARFALAQNFPNPFNPQTTIRYDVPATGLVRLAIYDVRGRMVRTLVDAVITAGYQQAVWNARDDAGRRVASGLYFYRMEAPGFAQQRKLLVIE